MQGMTKGDLIDAMKDYPNDTPIAVAIGTLATKAKPEGEFFWLNKPFGNIKAISVAPARDAIILEL